MSESEPQMLVVGGRKRGRPEGRNESEWQTPVSVRIPRENYEKLVKFALKRDQKLSVVVRQILLAQSFLK